MRDDSVLQLDFLLILQKMGAEAIFRTTASAERNTSGGMKSQLSQASTLKNLPCIKETLGDLQCECTLLVHTLYTDFHCIK